jgi:hypothetical protein
MLLNKSIKKLILVSLLIVIPAQTMALSWPSFSNIKNNVGQFILNAKQSLKKYSITVAVAVGGCVATCAAALGFKKKENVAAIALGSCVAVYASKIYHQRKEAERIAKEDAKLDAALAEQYSIEQEEQEQDVKIAEENRHEMKQSVAKKIAEHNAGFYKLLQRPSSRNLLGIKQKAEPKESTTQDRIQEQQRKLMREKKMVARNAEVSSLTESFYELSRNETKIVTSPLTRSYIQALYYPNTSLEKIIAQVNSYTPDEREKLAQRMPHEIDAETADEIRAFEFIEHGYANLAHILNNNIDAVSGYNRVARMSDEECTEFQSAAKAQEKEEIRQDYLRSIISVVWALYDCALRTGDAFTQGAFHMQNKKLQDFFLHYIIFVNKDHRQLGLLGGNCNHPHAYQRISSHLSALSKEKEIFQYGIDIRFGENGVSRNFLPNKMTHILFIPYDPEHNKFILKPEDDCMYNVKEIAWHGVGLVRSKLEGLVGSADSENHQRKERIPKKVIQKFDQLITSSGIAREQQEQYKKEIRSWGIQRIVSLENEFAAGSAMYQYINELKQYKHYTMRFGQEVIFSEEELKELISLWEKAEIE